LVFGLHTSERDFPCPDLYIGGVWHCLEFSFSWVETLAFSSFQQDVPATRGVGHNPSSFVFGTSSHIHPLEAHFVLLGAFCSNSCLLS
jgi:hypothetical protein